MNCFPRKMVGKSNQLMMQFMNQDRTVYYLAALKLIFYLFDEIKLEPINKLIIITFFLLVQESLTNCFFLSQIIKNCLKVFEIFFIILSCFFSKFNHSSYSNRISYSAVQNGTESEMSFRKMSSYVYDIERQIIILNSI